MCNDLFRMNAVARRTVAIGVAIGAMVFVLRPKIARAALRLRIHRLHAALDMLREHAAAARTLSLAYDHAMASVSPGAMEALTP